MGSRRVAAVVDLQGGIVVSDAVKKLQVFDQGGAAVGDFEIDPAELSPTINRQLLHDAVVMYQSNLRIGSAKTKSRAEVAGSTRKMYRQKGTGNARAGSRRSGVRRGGGHIFAKRPRDWTYRLPRKMLRAATRMALAARLMDDEVTLVERLSFEQPRTRDMVAVLRAVGCDAGKLLIVTEKYDFNVYLSGRNIAGVKVAPEAELNALSILWPHRVLMEKAALESFLSRVKSQRSATAASGSE